MSDLVEQYPRWARKLAHGIRARLGNTFVLHGNTHDLVPVPATSGRAGAPEFVPLTRFLSDWVFGQRDVVIEYQRANGAIFHTPESHQHFVGGGRGGGQRSRHRHARSLPREPGPFLSLLDSFLKQAILRQQPLGVAILFPYAETLIPESAGEFSAEDRAVRVFIQKWATDPALLAANVSFVLVTENLADLEHAHHPLAADGRDRGRAAGRARSGSPICRRCADAEWFQTAARSSRRTARPVHLGAHAHSASPDRVLGGPEQGRGWMPRTLREQKKAVIEAECFGLLEYVESTFTLDMVAGHEGVKERLRRAARAIMAGRLRGVPMGYLIAGPVGSAKTFLVNCFTGEIGFPCVKFLNFRSQWQGVTEGNLEKILKLLHAMWPVGVIIDEADAFLGDRNQQGDSGTSNRVFAQFATFMGNTEYRGKILWFLITSGRICCPST